MASCCETEHNRLPSGRSWSAKESRARRPRYPDSGLGLGLRSASGRNAAGVHGPARRRSSGCSSIFNKKTPIGGEPVLQQRHTNSWAVSLSEEQACVLQEALGRDHRITRHEGFRSALREEPEPFMIWLSAKGLRELVQLPEKRLAEWYDAPKALLLEPGYTLADFEAACNAGITDIVLPPFGKERLADIMRRALEVRSIAVDLDCMSREISVERELLERKNDILAFLVSFLTHSTESQSIEDLLHGAFENMSKLLPLTSLHAALWENADAGPAEACLYIAAPEGSAAHHAWKETLLAHAFRSSCPSRADLCTKFLRPGRQGDGAADMPDKNTLLCLPLVCGQERLGILLLQTAVDKYLGRDQALALDSALRHFSLTLKNARRFKKLQMHADYDALTQVHSRRHFESRMEEEVRRFTRYGEPLSMIMVDIDHFKAVNDTFGHHVGDLVLREVAAVLAASIRNTDYCARYGGEEFVVILPHTDGHKAHSLAERMRRRIARHAITTDKAGPLHVTASLGVASLADGDDADRHTLLCNADSALYTAKSNGRNQTCAYSAALLSAPATLAVCRNVI